MNEMADTLLAADEPAPVTVHNENGSSPFLFVADLRAQFLRMAGEWALLAIQPRVLH
jgi:hypothetical protein